MTLHSQIDIDIERLGIGGEGVGRKDGLTIFVDGALPGEKARCSVYEKKKSYGKARVLELLSTSTHRVKPICPLFGRCGGCQIMHLSYEEQLKAKRQKVVDALERIGKFKDVCVKECRASPKPLHYRNKIQIPIVPSAKGLRFGLYAKNSHDLVDVETCYIHCERGEEAYQKIREILKAFDQIRHLLIKTAVATGEVLVVIVSALQPTEELKRVAEKILSEIPSVKGVVHNLNTDKDNTVLGAVYTTLAGKDAIEEILCGVRFKVSSASFFQVNPEQAEQLYDAALHASQVTKDDTVLDAYCGVGTMSILFAKKASKVIGVEAVPEAIEDARVNALKNGIKNTSFHAALAEEFIQRSDEKIDIVILNPPRKGCDPALIEKVGAMRLKRIVYVSCDPATLARDLRLLADKGWTLESVEPFDMFPQTAHVETIATLITPTGK